MSRAKENIPTPPAQPWIELAESELRRAGHRSSAPRSAVLELLAGESCVLSAHEIAARLRAQRRPVGIATVYRALDLLEQLRLVQRLDLGGGSARYEAALPGGAHHHHHFLCEDCGTVTPFDDDGLERAIEALAKRLSYRVGDHDVILRGSCGRCG